MIANLPILIIPLQVDALDAIHVSNTRVTLDTLLARHQQGDSPEAIHAGFPTVPLADIYAVIAYYLTYRDAVDAYLKRRDEVAEGIRQEIEANYTPKQQLRIQALKTMLAQKRQEQSR
jgi:uncharacterized protein (DUF433 family)